MCLYHNSEFEFSLLLKPNPDPPGKLMTNVKWIIAVHLMSTHLELLAYVIMARQKLFADKNNFHRVFVERESVWLILPAVWFTNFQTKVLLMLGEGGGGGGGSDQF